MTFLTCFCFTINNYDDSDIEAVRNMDCQYVIFGYEVGKSGTPHLQGYMELKKKKRFTTLKKLLPRANLGARWGTQEQASEYCKKEGKFEERGTLKKQGKRNDLCCVRQCAMDEGMRGVTRIYNLQQIQVAEKFLTYNDEERNWKPKVIWIWGPTGVGKSRMAREIAGSEDIFTKNTATKWWSGYDGHEAVIIDDFRSSWWDLTYMLGLLDRYPFAVEIKGGQRQMLATTMVVTSAFPPEDCYAGTGEAVQQLTRRIDTIYFIGPDGVPHVPEVALGNTKANATEEIDTKLYNEDAMSLIKLLMG